jgi:hypothetical protein
MIAIAIVKRLFKFGEKIYKVGSHDAPELHQDNWFLNHLVEKGFLTLSSTAKKVEEAAKVVEQVAEDVSSISETVEEVSKRGRPKKEAATSEV